jgi:hypothetical protein
LGRNLHLAFTRVIAKIHSHAEDLAGLSNGWSEPFTGRDRGILAARCHSHSASPVRPSPAVVFCAVGSVLPRSLVEENRGLLFVMLTESNEFHPTATRTWPQRPEAARHWPRRRAVNWQVEGRIAPHEIFCFCLE